MKNLAKELYEKHGGNYTPYDQLPIEDRWRWERVATLVTDLLKGEDKSFGNVGPNPG